MESDDIIEHLTQVKGIGVCDRAHVPHLYAEALPDVLPTGDLGIRKGFQILWAQRTTRPRADGETFCKRVGARMPRLHRGTSGVRRMS